MSDEFDREELSIEDLFEDEEEDVAEEQMDLPGVYVALPSSPARYINVRPGMTVAQVLSAADIYLSANDQSIWIGGVQAGLDTVVQPGDTITAVGRAKGG